MNTIKSLVLGSAAALVAMTGAQAADLPLKAKAVEYVKVCSLYGAGFYYIPGTDTCIKLGGYLRVETGLNTNSIYNVAGSGVAGANNQLSNYYTSRSRQDLTLDTRTATEYGVVRTFMDLTFSWTSGGYTGGGVTAYDSAPAGSVGNGSIAGGATGVYFAFIQFAGFTMGKAISQFDASWVNYPGNNFDGLVGGGGTVTGVNQFTYTAQFGNGVSGSLSAQDQVQYGNAGVFNLGLVSGAGLLTGSSAGYNDVAGTRVPDLIATLEINQAWGGIKGSFAAHNNTPGYYGATELTGHPNDNWGFAGQLALGLKDLPTGPGDTFNIQGVYTDGATRYNLQSLSPLGYSIYSGTSTPGAYQSVGFATAGDSVFTPGGQLENIRTYGGRAGFTHNWSPFWNSSLYGAAAAIRYGNGGKAAICAVAVAGLGLNGTCNPDFNIYQAGLITRWTPVKNLTFSADFNYTRLDQAYSGTIAAPASAATAKPATIYQLKDQNTYQLLLRAQRNF